MYYLHVQIRCLIGHASESKKVFEINDPKYEQGKILLILALLYTGSSQKTKTWDGKTWMKFWKLQANLRRRALAEKCMERIAVSHMMELSVFKPRASMEEAIYCLHQKINKSIYMSDSSGISGALRSTPTDAMEVIAGLIPLDLHIMELAARSRARTKPLVKDTWDGINGSQKGPGKVVGHRKYWDKFIEEIGKLERPPQRENSWLEWEFLDGEAELTLYTDGAGNSQGAGYGFVDFEGNRLWHSENGPLGRIGSTGWCQTRKG